MRRKSASNEPDRLPKVDAFAGPHSSSAARANLAVTLRPASAQDSAALTACVCAAYLPYIDRIGRQPGPML